jgi:autotransporter-associated beta strand protein
VNTAVDFTLPITVNSGADLALNGITTSGGHKISLSKVGAGVLELGGTSTYTGSTSVAAGVLSLDAGASLESDALNVSGGGALQGLGASGAVEVADGTFSPGIPEGSPVPKAAATIQRARPEPWRSVKAHCIWM